MVTCLIKYTIDPNKLDLFEEYGKKWMHLVERFGGNHRGYFLPYEGANHIAYALFDFNSLSDYESYRKKSNTCPDCINAYDFATNAQCIVHYERSFLKPIS